MARTGFIQNELDLKLLVLYIMSRTAAPVTFNQLLDVALCDAGVDYFSLTEVVGHLVETGHLEQNGQVYAITEKGRRNSEICESSLPYSVRMQVDQNLVSHNERLKRRALVQAQVQERPEGGYTVTLALSDELDNLMKLELLVTREDMAQTIQKNFKADAESIYSRILAVLFNPEEGRDTRPSDAPPV